MVIILIIIALALLFDFINGFHDAANSIATVVSTKVLTPTQAVIWAAFFNFIAFFIAKYILGGFGIADTISKVIVLDQIESSPSVIVISGLIAAIIWNLLTWILAIPSSSSHTLIGGLAGAALAASNFNFASIKGSVIGIIILFIFLAPLIGMISGNIITIITINLVKNMRPLKADAWFKRLQLISSAALSIGHGLNDSQKVMGVIAFALVANQGIVQDNLQNMDHWILSDIFHWKEWFIMNNLTDIHDWVPISCFSAIALGTVMGGWKIIKTMGNKITKITPIEGFCAQTSSSLTLFLTEHYKVPVSTTHVITGSIIGVGSVKRLSAVRWGVTIELLWAWILTIPISALIAIITYYLIHYFII